MRSTKFKDVAEEILFVADKYQIEGLKRMCDNYLRMIFDPNFLVFLEKITALEKSLHGFILGVEHVAVEFSN